MSALFLILFTLAITAQIYPNSSLDISSLSDEERHALESSLNYDGKTYGKSLEEVYHQEDFHEVH
ncbi:unnamed protein product [Hymenolepis diminuta]|uniref:Uncharacterized protein n=1 Tax=Hymenolepis diminuta TaxID=6216 RepID=A0A564Z5K6_HYMDI|nr:unnamed protein product [Hymenolepis diminuta]